MKAYKFADAVISSMLIIIFGILFFRDEELSIISEPLIEGYIVVGGWHIISMIAHIVLRKNIYFSQTRKIYTIISFLLVVTIPAGSVWILVFTAPFMAVFYTGLCFFEVYNMNSRPITLLK